MLKKCVFNRLSIGMIPASYRESLTYEEQILWLQKYLNEMLEWLSKLQQDFDNIDLNFDEIEHEIATIKESIYNVNTEIERLKISKADVSYVNSEVQNIKDSLASLIRENYDILKEEIDTNVERLQYEIDHIDIGKILIYDPSTGLQESIQTVIDNIYDLTRVDGISAGEFDNLLLTASAFDSKDLTAYNFDQHGKSLLQP